jgi:hypothetical protein
VVTIYSLTPLNENVRYVISIDLASLMISCTLEVCTLTFAETPSSFFDTIAVGNMSGFGRFSLLSIKFWAVVRYVPINQFPSFKINHSAANAENLRTIWSIEENFTVHDDMRRRVVHCSMCEHFS